MIDKIKKFLPVFIIAGFSCFIVYDTVISKECESQQTVEKNVFRQERTKKANKY